MWSFTTDISSMDMCFILKNMGRVERHNSRLCVKGLTSNKFEVDYYEKLEEVSELQNYSEHDKVFLFKWYWYDTNNRGIREDHHHGLVEINSKSRLYNFDDVFVCIKQY